MQLITPNSEIVDIFNSFWTESPKCNRIKIFSDEKEIDITNYIKCFRDYDKKDQKIYSIDEIDEFFSMINEVYHTRVINVKKIGKTLREKYNVKSKEDFRKIINDRILLLPEFVRLCKIITGNYAYSFASKVFSFIDDNYPIIDSLVATLLNTYNYTGKIPKGRWGNYCEYIKNYNAFKCYFELENLSCKTIDKFLWTYAKVLKEYWYNMGVLRFEAIPFDKNISGCIWLTD